MQNPNVAIVENPGTEAQAIVPYCDLHTVKYQAFASIRRYMNDYSFSPEKMNDLITAVGELITNVGKHAYDDESHCQVIIEIKCTESYITVIVTDFGQGEIVEPTSVDPLSEKGRGLFMAMQVAEIIFLNKIDGFHSVQATIRK